jgi:AAA+ ATPase superfamily predicted ATPase
LNNLPYLVRFVDRTTELAELRRVLGSPRPVLVRVYGRRRLGKTELLRKLCREERGLYLLVDEADPPQQRESLSRQVAAEANTLAVPYPTWDAFLDHVARLDRRFVVLDEFQRMLAPDPQAASRLQHRWDTRLRETGPSIILCGSSVGMMQRITARKAAPLFGRLAGDLRLRPFGYAAVRLLYPELDEEERVRRYAIYGGAPFYHEFSVGRVLRDAVRDAFLAPTAPLAEEPQNLLRLELQSPTRYNSILYEIGQGTHDLRGLESKVGVKRGGLGPYLETLRRDLDLIRMEDPVCGVRRQARYVFDDPFFAFYYRFVFENRPLLELGRWNAVWDRIESGLDQFIGPQFERVARESLVLLNGSEWNGVPIDFEEIGRWWNREGEEIDIAAAGRDTVLAGEVSWSRSPMRLGDLRRLEMKARKIERLRDRSVRFVLIARGGFESELTREARSQGALLLDLAALAEVFDRRYAKPT